MLSVASPEIMEGQETLHGRKKRTRRGKKRYKSDSFDFGCIDSREKESGLTDLSFMTTPTKQPRKRPNTLRPRSPRAPQNSTSYIIDNHIEGVKIDLSPHVEDDLPMYLANASWVIDRSSSQCLTSYPDVANKHMDTNEVSLYQDDGSEKYELSPPQLSPAYSDIDYEYVSPIRNVDRYSYMCKDFDDNFKSAKEIELAHQTKEELHKNILSLEERLCNLENKSTQKVSMHSISEFNDCARSVNPTQRCAVPVKTKSQSLAQMLEELKQLQEENKVLSNTNIELKQACVS